MGLRHQCSNEPEPPPRPPPTAPQAYLLCKPDPAGLSDPLPGVDASVDPDGGAVVSPSAELNEKSREVVRLVPGLTPGPEASCSLALTG